MGRGIQRQLRLLWAGSTPRGCTQVSARFVVDDNVSPAIFALQQFIDAVQSQLETEFTNFGVFFRLGAANDAKRRSLPIDFEQLHNSFGGEILLYLNHAHALR